MVIMIDVAGKDVDKKILFGIHMRSIYKGRGRKEEGEIPRIEKGRYKIVFSSPSLELSPSLEGQRTAHLSFFREYKNILWLIKISSRTKNGEENMYS